MIVRVAIRWCPRSKVWIARSPDVATMAVEADSFRSVCALLHAALSATLEHRGLHLTEPPGFVYMAN